MAISHKFINLTYRNISKSDSFSKLSLMPTLNLKGKALSIKFVVNGIIVVVGWQTSFK